MTKGNFVLQELSLLISVVTLNTPNTQRLVTCATKIVQRKKKRLFDGNGMNSFSCKDTKYGAQLTLIYKNVI